MQPPRFHAEDGEPCEIEGDFPVRSARELEKMGPQFTMLARFLTWVSEIFSFGIPHYPVYLEGAPRKGERRIMEILGDRTRYAPMAGAADTSPTRKSL